MATSREATWQQSTSVWLLLIVVVGAALRLIALGHKSFWIDEIASVAIAQRPGPAFWRFLWHDEGNMAAYYVLLRPWLHIGHGEAIVRLLSVLPGVLSIPYMYVFGRRLFGSATGLLAAALFALNPCAIAGSQEARAYSFLVLAVIVSSVRFIRLVETPSYRFAIAYGLAAGFTCYFHYFGVLVPAAHAVSLLALPRGTRPWKQYRVAAVIVVVLAIPILWLIHAQDVGHISWVQSPSLLELYHLGVFLAASSGKAAGATLLTLDLALVGFFLRRMTGIWRVRDNDLERWRYALVASSFFTPIVIALAVSLIRPAFYHRFLVVCLPFWVMMAAVGAVQIPRPAWRGSVVAMVVALCLVNTVLLYTRVTEDWRGVVDYLIAHAGPEDRVLYYQSVGAFAAENYWNWRPGGGSGPRAKEVDVDSLSTRWESEIDHAPRVWLVLYRAESDDPESRAIEQELLKSYDAGVQKTFRGVRVIEYEAKR
ncbi:MAG: glycosyltransferase family 39 protein [Candidatus Korobacteraceae bacterium]